MDTFGKKKRSAIMASVKSKQNKSTEKKVRAALISKGIKGWKMHEKTLPGKPDFVFPKNRLIVFIDGCFWHGCSECYRRPKTSRAYWDAKVIRNRKRDLKNNIALRRLGWRVVRLWEHELRPFQVIPNRLLRIISP